ncbi:MAG: hypothetical protein LBP23_09260 [Treponema sp.]|jgi:hypothetical protein|nr:hypothetical protein [Treponema sp.]
MKHKVLIAALGAAALLMLGTCDNGTTPVGDLVSPITFTGTWETGTDSVYTIVRGPRYLTVNEDWSFTYTCGDDNGTPTNPMDDTGGFSQAKIDMGSGNYYYPPIVVKGKLIYDGDGYYIFAPDSGYIDLQILYNISAAPVDKIDLPDATVQTFREHAKIFYVAADQLKMVDNGDEVADGIGFLEGTWAKQP